MLTGPCTVRSVLRMHVLHNKILRKYDAGLHPSQILNGVSHLPVCNCDGEHNPVLKP